jgi:hypothetical protein
MTDLEDLVREEARARRLAEWAYDEGLRRRLRLIANELSVLVVAARAERDDHWRSEEHLPHRR